MNQNYYQNQKIHLQNHNQEMDMHGSTNLSYPYHAYEHQVGLRLN